MNGTVSENSDGKRGKNSMRLIKRHDEFSEFQVNGRVIKIDNDDIPLLDNYRKWHIASKSNWLFYLRSTSGKSTIYLHRMIMRAGRGQIIDHINGDALDNRRCNLRFVTARENSRNSQRRAHGFTSKYKGVCLVKNRNGFRARIRTETGVRIHLGDFKSEIDAAIAYNDAAKTYHGEHARLNNV